MNLIRNFVVGVVLCVTLFSMYGGIYTSFKSHYGFTNTYTGVNGTTDISDRIEALGVIQSIQTFTAGIFQVLNPSTPFDILGGLAVTAFGVLSTLFNLLAFPVSLFGIVTGFYYIPQEIPFLIGIIATISFGFIYLSARLKADI